MEYERHPVSTLLPDMSKEKFDALSHWKAAHDHAAMAVGEAWECGAALSVVKAGLEHGAFAAWLAENHIQPRTAQRWMRLAQEMPVYEAVELGSIDAALKQIAEKRTSQIRQADVFEPTSNGAICTISPDTGESAHTNVTVESSQTNQGRQSEYVAEAIPQEPPTEQALPAKTYGQLQKENAALERQSILQQQQINVLQNELGTAKVRIEALELEGLQPSQQGARLTELQEEIKIYRAASNKWQQYHVDERKDRKRFQFMLKKTRRELEQCKEQDTGLKADLAELR